MLKLQHCLRLSSRIQQRLYSRPLSSPPSSSAPPPPSSSAPPPPSSSAPPPPSSSAPPPPPPSSSSAPPREERPSDGVTLTDLSPEKEIASKMWFPKSFSDIPMDEELFYTKPEDVVPVEDFVLGKKDGMKCAIETRRIAKPGPANQEDPAEKKARLTVYMKECKLQPHEEECLIELLGCRYNPASKRILITSDRFASPDDNVDDCVRMLKESIAAAKEIAATTTESAPTP